MVVSGLRVDRNAEMPTRDGTVLRGDVWRPDDDRPYPVLLQRTPYQKELSAIFDALPADYAVRAGYAVVVQDTRGRFASDGVWGGFTPRMWDIEAHDTYDTVEWIADQPWCDGGVGIFGQSYLGAVALLGAEQRPPHLKAIAPGKIGCREQAHLDTGGAFWLTVWLTLPLAMLAADPHTDPADRAEIEAALRAVPALPDFLPLRDWPHFDVPGMPVTLKQVLSGDVPGPPLRFDLERVAVPTLCIGGWFDFYTSRTIDQFQRLRQGSGGGQRVRQAHQLLVGPWQHGPELPDQGELTFGPAAAGPASLHPAQLAFFDRHLKGNAATAAPVRYFLMGADEWRDADDWPPPGVHTRQWYLRAGAALSSDAPTSDETPDRYTYDPGDPTPTVGGRAAPLGGPRDLARLAARADVLAYASDPLPEPIDLIGQITVRLFAASSAVDTDFVARLADLHPGGRALYVASGLARARYRHGQHREVPLAPGSVERYDISLGHTAWRVLPGHRLSLLVCSSDHPWLDRNMNTGNPLGHDSAPVVAHQSIFHDPGRPSRLEVHIYPRTRQST